MTSVIFAEGEGGKAEWWSRVEFFGAHFALTIYEVIAKEVSPMRNRSLWIKFGIVATLGIELVAVITVTLGVGLYVDNRYGTAPLFTLCGVFLGMGASIRLLLLRLKQLNREDDDSDE